MFEVRSIWVNVEWMVDDEPTVRIQVAGMPKLMHKNPVPPVPYETMRFRVRIAFEV